MKGVYTFFRYFAALMVIQYGFAKINDAQFTVLQSVPDQPLREVSGFWLTWYYFGYSEVYGNLIALVQIAGGVMLLFLKTTLIRNQNENGRIDFSVTGRDAPAARLYGTGGL